LKVCVLCPDLTHYDFGLIGNARVAHELLTHLAERGPEVFALTNLQAGRHIPPDLDYQTITFPGDGTSRSFALRVLKYLALLRPDVVHGHGGIGMAAILAAVKRLHKIRCVLTVTQLPSPRAPNLAWGGLKEIDVVISLTKYVHNYFRARRLRSWNSVIIPYGLNERFVSVRPEADPLSFVEKGPRLCFWGSGSVTRGFGVLLEAFPRLIKARPELQMVAALRNIESASLSKVHSLWRQGHLHLLVPRALSGLPEARIYPTSVEHIVAKTDVVALPFLVNPCEPPLTIVESMALGMPIVTTDVNSNPELIGTNERGLIVPPNDAQALGTAVLTMLENPRDFAKMASEAKGFITNQFDDVRAASQILGIYQKLSRR